ncbi:MAG: hypothetical protein PHS44_06420 [Candidatus Dojkabacteria bacterium]|jgi:hypothetical protein|nr:hypothetical protein [Candidatus Dojkabacteria bacterium]
MKKGKTCLLLFVLFGTISCCLSSTIFLLLGFRNNWWGIFDAGKDNKIEFEEYLGFDFRPTEIQSIKEYNDALPEIAESMIALANADEKMELAAQKSDLKDFLKSYEEYNTNLTMIIENADGISRFFEKEVYAGNNSSFAVYATEKQNTFSLLAKYYGALYYGKHDVINTCKDGIYDYVTTELTQLEIDELLSYYNLANVEEIKSANDQKVAEMARDPELGGKLGGAINWTKVTEQLGETATYAWTESTVLTPFPAYMAGGVMFGGAKLEYTNYNQYMDNIKNAKVTVIGVSEKLEEITYESLKADINKQLSELDDLSKQLKELAEAYKEEENPLIFTKTDIGDAENFEIDIPTGNWEIIASADNIAPVNMGNIFIGGDIPKDLGIPCKPLSIDPEILKYIGFEGISDTGSSTTSTADNASDNICSDYGYVEDWDAETCENDYNSCLSYPYKLEAGYDQCISAGGCWDIGRPVEYENPESCPDDYSIINHPYKDSIVAYCDCIKDCKEIYQTERDCQQELITCCSDAMD